MVLSAGASPAEAGTLEVLLLAVLCTAASGMAEPSRMASEPSELEGALKVIADTSDGQEKPERPEESVITQEQLFTADNLS